jgi:hypothetical protein
MYTSSVGGWSTADCGGCDAGRVCVCRNPTAAADTAAGPAAAAAPPTPSLMPALLALKKPVTS